MVVNYERRHYFLFKFRGNGCSSHGGAHCVFSARWYIGIGIASVKPIWYREIITQVAEALRWTLISIVYYFFDH